LLVLTLRRTAMGVDAVGVAGQTWQPCNGPPGSCRLLSII